MHFNRQLEQIVKTLALRLRLGYVVTPDITDNGLVRGLSEKKHQTYIPCRRTSTA